MVKLIVSDMDGTLLNDAKQMPNDFFSTITKLQEKGIVFGVASGRQYYTLLEEMDQVKDSIYFIAENGSYVLFRDEILLLDAIQRDESRELIQIGRKIPNAFPILCGQNAAYVENADIDFLKEARQYYKHFQIVEDLMEVDDVVLKFTMCDFSNAEFNSRSYFNTFRNRFKITVGSAKYLDIMNKTVNKGKALQLIQQRLGIDARQTLVFGDYLNDLEMMKQAHYSFAMKNAHPEIIKVSNFMTKWTNNQQGVTRTLRDLGLIDAANLSGSKV